MSSVWAGRAQGFGNLEAASSKKHVGVCFAVIPYRCSIHVRSTRQLCLWTTTICCIRYSVSNRSCHLRKRNQFQVRCYAEGKRSLRKNGRRHMRRGRDCVKRCVWRARKAFSQPGTAVTCLLWSWNRNFGIVRSQSGLQLSMLEAADCLCGVSRWTRNLRKASDRRFKRSHGTQRHEKLFLTKLLVEFADEFETSRGIIRRHKADLYFKPGAELRVKKAQQGP